MREETNSQGAHERSRMNGSNEERRHPRNWWVQIVSVLAVGYLIFSLLSPMFVKEGQQTPGKIETPDIILIALVLLFNSGLLNRLENLGVSKEGITVTLREVTEKLSKQEGQIDELYKKQVDQLSQQQQDLQEMYAFMYTFLLTDTDYEKIAHLAQHAQAGTSYNIAVWSAVGDELRNLRNLNLVETINCHIQEIVDASKGGGRLVDLTKYLRVTDKGKKFLETYEKLHSHAKAEQEGPESNAEVEKT